MKKVLYIMLWLSLYGCAMHNASGSKAMQIQQRLAGGYFHCNLALQDTNIHLKSDSTFVYKKGPFRSYGKWRVSSDAKYLYLNSNVKKSYKDLSLIYIHYQLKIKNANTIILEEHKWIYKRAENIPRE